MAIEQDKLIADVIYNTININVPFNSEKDRYVKLYGYTMLFFDENNIDITPDNVEKHKIDIENYILDCKDDLSKKHISFDEKTSNENVSQKVKKNKPFNNLSNFQKLALFVVACLGFYYLTKKK